MIRKDLKFIVVNRPSVDDLDKIGDLLKVRVVDRRSKVSYGVWPVNDARRKFQ
ncbi:MAG: hypothetical protein AB7D26_12215 [Marinobacterium sp.]